MAIGRDHGLAVAPIRSMSEALAEPQFAERGFLAENTAGTVLRELPTFGIPLVQSGLLRRLPVGDFDRTKLVHADQSLQVHTRVEPSGIGCRAGSSGRHPR